jgi:hypothetical protein
MIFDEENATLWIGKLKLMSWKHRSKNQNKISTDLKQPNLATKNHYFYGIS